MTVSSTVNREQYATNGVTTAFTIHFPFFNDTDVHAVFVDVAGNATPLSLNADYTVAGGGGAGGSLVTTLAPAGGGTLTLYRELAFTQEDDYVEDDPLPADTLEGGFDRAVMRDQQLKDASDRALTFPPTIPPGVSAELPNPQANTLLGWNSTADGLENKVLEPATTVYASTANTNTGTAVAESVTPRGLHDSIYNIDATIISITGEATAVAAGTAKKTFRLPMKLLGTEVRASLNVAQSAGSILTIDINKNGVSILSTKLTIDNTEKTSVTAAIPAVLSDTNWLDDAEFSVDVDQIGNGTAQGLKVTMKGRLVA